MTWKTNARGEEYWDRTHFNRKGEEVPDWTETRWGGWILVIVAVLSMVLSVASCGTGTLWQP